MNHDAHDSETDERTHMNEVRSCGIRGMTGAEAERWLRIHPRRTTPKLRLVGFPYAGGSVASFHAWHDVMPAEIEFRALQLPARHDRLHELPLVSVASIVERVISAISALPRLPLALYGHSFGSLIAFEVARRLEAQDNPVRAIIVAAHRPPHIAAAKSAIHGLAELDFLRALHQRYRTLEAVLQDSELRELVLPALRADFQALETYQYIPGKISAPIFVLRGKQDTDLTPEHAMAWHALTASESSTREVDAGHFFMESHAAWTVQQVASWILV
jgi:surfactin synthase thioesterase subunit